MGEQALREMLEHRGSCHLESRGFTFSSEARGRRWKLAIYIDTLLDAGSWFQEVGGAHVWGMYISPVPCPAFLHPLCDYLPFPLHLAQRSPNIVFKGQIVNSFCLGDHQVSAGTLGLWSKSSHIWYIDKSANKLYLLKLAQPWFTDPNLADSYSSWSS